MRTAQAPGLVQTFTGLFMALKKRRGKEPDSGGDNRVAVAQPAKEAAASPVNKFAVAGGVASAVLLGGWLWWQLLMASTSSTTSSTSSTSSPLLHSTKEFAPYEEVRTLTDPAKIGTAAWDSASLVEIMDFTAPGAREQIKRRLRASAAPVVVVNAAQKFGELMSFGNISTLQRHMKIESKAIGKLKRSGKIPPGGLLDTAYAKKRGGLMQVLPISAHTTAMAGCKKSDTFKFAYWDDSIAWLGHKSMASTPDQPSWHRWNYRDNVGSNSFFSSFNESSSPFLYWYSQLPHSIIKMDPWETLCEYIAASEYEKDCRRGAEAHGRRDPGCACLRATCHTLQCHGRYVCL